MDDDGFESFNGNGSSPSDNYEDAKVPRTHSLDLSNTNSNIVDNAPYATIDCVEMGEYSKTDKKCNKWVNNIALSAESGVFQRCIGSEIKESSKESNSDTYTNKTSTSAKRTSRVTFFIN